MATIEIIQAPHPIGPLTLNITTDGGQVTGVTFALAGRKWPLQKLTAEELQWVFDELHARSIGREKIK